MSEQMLPKNWRSVKIGDIANVMHGGTPSKSNKEFWVGNIPWVSPKDMRPIVIEDTVDHITLEAINGSSTRLVPQGTILIVARSGILVRILPVSVAGTELAFNQDIKALSIDTDLVDAWFLVWWLKSQESHILTNGVKKGATVHSLKTGFIESLKLPLPPLTEQQRITAIIEEQMSDIDSARIAIEAELEAAEALTASYLREVFESDEAGNWECVPLGDLGDIRSGITLGRKLAEDVPVYSVPYLRVANVKDGYLDLADVKQIEASEDEIKRYHLENGDILLTEGGDPDKLGRGTFWQEEISNCIHQNHIFRVRFDLDKFLPQFLSLQIGSSYGKKYFLAHAKQTTGIATINQAVLKRFPLLVPTLSEQQQILAILDEKIADVDRIQAAVERQREAIKKMPSMVLRRAFNGE